ncbi:MAG: M20/M25/M40 family metallo-hydrolase [Gammaproteobacteria bacterium]|nr:M20/M25/M40 family metallo-hydrolase [Gammaproteobacteria bacterium]
MFDARRKFIATFIPFFLLTNAYGAETAPAADASSFSLTDRIRERAVNLRETALEDDRAFDALRSLTTEVGERNAGSPGDRAAVIWALDKMREFGLTNIRTENVTVPHWERGTANAEITAPFPQRLVAVALGGSIGTPDEGIEAPVLAVESIEELKTLEDSEVSGKIVYFNGRMERSRDGSSYVAAVQKRVHGPKEAASKGAVAVVIRSVGTSNNRIAHTGITRYDDAIEKIPAIAISNPDADMLDTQLETGQTVTLKMRLTSRMLPDEVSANVIGEVPGRGNSDEIILLAAHLDSWDAGTGAQDDAAGVAIVMAAARLISELRPRPERSVRVVLYANEEFGLSGAKAYDAAYKDQLAQHILAMEADGGAGRVWRFDSRVPEGALPVVDAIYELIAPLDIERGNNEAYGGADIKGMRDAGVPVLGPRQDTSTYFDIHHTENDTLDKIDPAAVRQNVAVYVTAAYIAADIEEDFGRLEIQTEAKQ